MRLAIHTLRIIAFLCPIAFSACAKDPSSSLSQSTSDSSGETDTGEGAPFFTPGERATILTWLGPLPDAPPASPSNMYADDPVAAEFGQKMFFETGLSSTGTISCASCHDPDTGFSDNRSNTSQGVGFTERSSMPLLNGAYGAAAEEAQIWQFWDGRCDSQWCQALGPVENPIEMGGSRSAAALLVYDDHRADYEAAFGTIPELRDGGGTPLIEAGAMPGDAAWDGASATDREQVNTVYVNMGKAIAAYERLLVSKNSRFDAFWRELDEGAEDSDELSDSEKAGLRVFLDKGRCLGCHSGPNFTDGQFHNLAVPQIGDNVPPSDLGRAEGLESLRLSEFNCAGPWSDHGDKTQCAVSTIGDGEGELGAFKTPTLRSVSLTGPYMHTGSLTTLEQVVSHYDLGGGAPGTFDGIRDELMRPLSLDFEERQNLANFMRALEGESLPAALRNPVP